MAAVSSPVTVSAGLAVELYLVRQTLDEHSADGRTDETTLATLSLLEVCLEKTISLTLDSVNAEFWNPIRHWEEKAYSWPELAATIVDPASRESVARAAFGELVWRLRFLTTKLKGKYKWDVFEFPQGHVLSGFQVIFSQHGRIHIEIGSQWSEKVWEIKLDENFLQMAGLGENLEFVKETCEIIYEREKSYDIMLSWLVSRPGMTSVESFQVKSAGISRTVSLELGIAAELSTRRHERRELGVDVVKRKSERESTRGLLDPSDDAEVNHGQLVMNDKISRLKGQRAIEVQKKKEEKVKKMAERARRQLHRQFPIRLNKYQ
ncbi:hypothetical protein V8E51_018587 [Hyaloscypha variabilis]